MLPVLVLGLALHAAPTPKVSEPAALKVAAARVPHGTLKDHELEREHGRWIYSFEFQVPGRSGIQEVNVDANSGKVISVEHEAD